MSREICKMMGLSYQDHDKKQQEHEKERKPFVLRWHSEIHLCIFHPFIKNDLDITGLKFNSIEY